MPTSGVLLVARYKRFTFLCDGEERRILAALARRLERSQSDAVRWLIRGAAEELQVFSRPSDVPPLAGLAPLPAHIAQPEPARESPNA